MECGRLGVDGISAQRHVVEDGGKDLVHVQIQSPNIQVKIVMEKILIQRTVIHRSAPFMVSQILNSLRNLNCFFIRMDGVDSETNLIVLAYTS